MRSFNFAAMSFMLTLALGEEAVKTLTADNFDEFITQNEATLVKFYAPWCGHCKSLAEPYEKAAAQLAEEGNTSVRLAKVDADEHKSLGQRFEVQGFPTLKWFTGSVENPTEYSGGRTQETIVQWIKEHTGPAVTAGEPTGEDKLSVTVYAASEPEWFSETAKAMRDQAKWYFVESTEEKLVLSHKNEAAISPEAPVADKDTLQQFVKDNKFPLFGELNGETFGEYVQSGKGLVWVLLPMEETTVDAVVEEQREKMQELSKELGSETNVVYANTAQFKDILKNMLTVDTFPTVVYQKKAGDATPRHILKGEENLSKEAIASFVQKVNNGEIEGEIKSAPVPENDDEPVKVAVGKTVKDIVFTADKDVLLEIYAPWCGHCKKLEPELNKVAKKLQKLGADDIMTLAKIDGTENDIPVESLSFTGFPTLYYVKAGSSEPAAYEGPRDAKGMWKWIRKNHSKSEELKEKVAASKAAKDEKAAKKEEL